jgi:hypothetical protein
MQPANNGQPAEQGQKLRRVHATEQVAHLWGNGIQYSIRNAQETASTSDNGRVLFSYAQAIAARTDVVDPDGRRVYLFNSAARESTTTQKHMRNANRAVPFHVCFTSNSSGSDAWDGRRETIGDATCLYYMGGAENAPTSAQVLTFAVPDVQAEGGHAHAANYKRMFENATAHAREMSKRRSNFYPSFVAQNFRAAAEYRALFCADYCADLADSFDWDALAAAFAKVKARKDKAEAAARARSAGYHAAEKRWMEVAAATLGDLAYQVRHAPDAGRHGLREAVAVYEATGTWDIAAETSPVNARVRRLVEHLIKNGGKGFSVLAQELGFKVAPFDGVAAEGMIKTPCPIALDAYPRPIERYVFGRAVRDEYPQLHRVYEAAGISRHDVGAAWGSKSPRHVIGRDLIRVSADSAEVITSGGARVPLALVAALWRRHGAEISAAAAEPCALTFPEARRVGTFAWIGYGLGDSAAWSSGGGASALLIGCHKVGAEDVARLARRLAWPEPEAASA